jgi:hypothetical protein
MWRDVALGDVWRHFGRSCEKGRLSAAQWLNGVFGFAAGDVRSAERGLLRCGLAGHLAVAQWLVPTFGIVAADVCESGALYVLCGSGRLEIATWLVAHCGITVRDLCDPCGCGVPKSEPTMPEVETWVCETFGLTAEDLRLHEEGTPLCCACGAHAGPAGLSCGAGGAFCRQCALPCKGCAALLCPCCDGEHRCEVCGARWCGRCYHEGMHRESYGYRYCPRCPNEEYGH